MDDAVSRQHRVRGAQFGHRSLPLFGDVRIMPKTCRWVRPRQTEVVNESEAANQSDQSDQSDLTWSVSPIGFVRSSRKDAIDDGWDAVEESIVLTPTFDERSLRGLDEFSHLEVVYLFDQVDPETVCTGARIPRGNPAWPEVGIFAQRAKFRPNRIGVSCCELASLEGTTLHLRGLDAVDGTPVLDIKPYMVEFGPRRETRQPAWSHELMAGYF